MEPLDYLLAKDAVHGLMVRYCRAVAPRDWEGLRACYHADAHDDHGGYGGGRDGLVEWVAHRHAAIPFTAHFIGNSVMDVTAADIVVAETYFIVFRRSRAPGDGGWIDTDSFGRYLDRIERRDGVWAIARRRVVLDEVRSRPAEGGGDGLDGRRDEADPLHGWLKTAGLPG